MAAVSRTFCLCAESAVRRVWNRRTTAARSLGQHWRCDSIGMGNEPWKNGASELGIWLARCLRICAFCFFGSLSLAAVGFGVGVDDPSCTACTPLAPLAPFAVEGAWLSVAARCSSAGFSLGVAGEGLISVDREDPSDDGCESTPCTASLDFSTIFSHTQALCRAPRSCMMLLADGPVSDCRRAVAARPCA